jgi:hypothetical protein
VFSLYDDLDASKTLAFQLSGTTGVITLLPPPANGTFTIAAINFTNTWIEPQIFSDIDTATFVLECFLDDSFFNNQFLNIADNGSTFNATLAIPGLGEPLTDNRVWTFPDANGVLPIRGNSVTPIAAGLMAKINATGQTADIASTKLTNATATGVYLVSYVLEDTSADALAGSVTLTVGWTDDAGATTATATQVLTATGRTAASVTLYLASGDITFSTSHIGIFGTSSYAVRIRVTYLG